MLVSQTPGGPPTHRITKKSVIKKEAAPKPEPEPKPEVKSAPVDQSPPVYEPLQKKKVVKKASSKKGCC
jgi:hypothetical protein